MSDPLADFCALVEPCEGVLPPPDGIVVMDPSSSEPIICDVCDPGGGGIGGPGFLACMCACIANSNPFIAAVIIARCAAGCTTCAGGNIAG